MGHNVIAKHQEFIHFQVAQSLKLGAAFTFLHSHFKSSESIYMFSDICINYATSQGVSCLHTIFPEALRKIPTFLVLFPVLGQEASQQSNSRMIPIESLKSNSIGEVTGG